MRIDPQRIGNNVQEAIQLLSQLASDCDARQNALEASTLLVFSSMAEMRTHGGSAQQLHLHGYYAPGDGGGGSFVKRAGTPPLDDGGINIVPTGSTTFWYQREFSGAIDVRWFGAVGDKVTDCYAAFLAAYNACPIGGVIYVPSAGNPLTRGYRMSGTWTLTKHVHVQGDVGWHFGGSHFVFDRGVDGILIGHPDGFPGVSIDGITVDAAGSPAGATGIKCWQRAAISNVEVINAWLDGIDIDGSVTGGNCNGWSLHNVRVNGFYRVGVRVHGSDANAGNGTLVDVANGQGEGPGILDKSQFGNTWLACQAAEVGLGHVNGGPSDPLPNGYGYGFSTIDPDAPGGSSPPSLFLGCYWEVDSPPRMGAASTWIGFSDNVLRTKPSFDTGTYIIPGQSRNISGAHQRLGVRTLAWSIGENTPTVSEPQFLFFKDATRTHGYHLAYSEAYRTNAFRDYWRWAWANLFSFTAFGMSDTNYDRGAGKFVLPNGFIMQSEIESAARWRGIGSKPLPFLRDVTESTGKAWQKGDRLEYPAPDAGAAQGRQCTRNGFYGDGWRANTPYLLGQYVVASPDNAHAFKCTGAGTSHATTQPTWNTGSGATTVDGSVTWTEVGASSIWTEYGQATTWRSLDASAATTIGFSGADVTLTTSISLFSLDITDSERDLASSWQRLLNTGAVQGSVVEFSRGNDGNASAVPILNHASAPLYNLPTGSATKRSWVKLVFTGTVWRPFAQGDAT